MKLSELIGLDVNAIKIKLISLNKKSLYKYLLYAITTIMLALTLLIYLNSNFSQISEVFIQKNETVMFYQAHNIFQIVYIIGLMLIILIELVALWQKKLKEVNDIPFRFLLAAYGVGIIYFIVSHPLISFMRSFLNNTDPFKSFIQSFQIVANINIFILSLSIVLMLFLFILTYLALLAKGANITLSRVKLRKRESRIETI